jgi:hypothetical protein
MIVFNDCYASQIFFISSISSSSLVNNPLINQKDPLYGQQGKVAITALLSKADIPKPSIERTRFLIE